MPPDQLRVMMYPAFSTRVKQPYNYLLSSALQHRGVTVEEFSMRQLLVSRYDVVHVHFPEYPLYHRPRRKAFRLAAMVTALLLWARLRGAKLVWTVHNLGAHEVQYPYLSALYWKAFTQQVDGFINLSDVAVEHLLECYPHLRRRPHVVVPHGHFRDEYPNEVSPEEARRRLDIPPTTTVFLFFGQVRPYKGVSELIKAFSDIDDPDSVLVVAGLPLQDSFAHELIEQAKGDPRVKLDLGFVSADRAQLYFNAADLVVLPYRQILNSGSALLALSFNRPVLVPEAGALGELRAHLGPDWVQTYTGPIDARAMQKAMAATTAVGGPADLSGFDWDRIGARTLELYRSLAPLRQDG